MSGFDASDAIKELRDWQTKALRGAEDGVHDVAEAVLGEGTRHVPIEEGTLQNSGQTAVQGLTAAVGWGKGGARDYAVRQHEDMSLNHDPGRTAKWGENALNSARRYAPQVITAAIKRRTS